MPAQPLPHKYGTVGGSPSAAPTRKSLPQPAPGPGSTGEADSDPELEHGDGKASFHLPSGKATRKMAGKAGKAATKGASKMASAFKKGLRRAQAIGEANPAGSAALGGADHTEDAAGLMDVEEGPECDAHQGGSLEEGALYDPSFHGAQRQGQRAVRPCQSLQVNSIWDIPTSRFPEPLPEPAHEPNDVEAQVIGSKSNALPPVAVSLKKGKKAPAKRGPRRKPCLTRRAKLALGAILALTAVAAAVIASL